MSKLIIGVVVGAVTALAAGWLFMLAVGIAHHEWLPQLPTIGYWWAVLIVSLLRGAFLNYERDDQ